MAIDFPPSEDMEPEGSNRLFIILAVGLAGLIVLGLVAIGGVLVLRNIRNQQALAQSLFMQGIVLIQPLLYRQIQIEMLFHRFGKTGDIPLLLQTLGR